MAGAATTLEREPLANQIDRLQWVLPEALVVSDMLTDQESRRQAASFIGSVTGPETVEVIPVPAAINSLYEAIQLAAEGDPAARNLVRTNARTDVIERTIKTGHVMDPILLDLTAAGGFMQYGQTTEQIQANSLLYAANHPIMRARTEAETRNTFRTRELYAAGFFEDYNLVVISRAEDLPEAGFFTETMSCCLQVTSKHGKGLQVESAFVSGIAAPGEPPHDEQTVIKLGKRLNENLDFSGKTPAQIIDTPILVRKDLMPNGAIDLVKLFDDCAGGTFFGEWRPRQDYVTFREACRQREKGFSGRVNQIVNDLLAEAGGITGPAMAIERLHKISEGHMVEHALTDTSIDLRVFGGEAAGHLEQARRAAQEGDWHGLDEHLKKAKETAETDSCPTGRNKDMTGDEEKDADGTSGDKSADKECDFISKECPVCKKKNVKTKVTKSHISGDCGCKVRKS